MKRPWEYFVDTYRRTPQTQSAILICFVLVCASVGWYATESERGIISQIRDMFGHHSCTEGQFTERYKCWNTALTQKLNEHQIEGALDLLADFSKESPDFITTCHAFAHRVGERAYQDSKGGEMATPSPAMQVCDFGFYHGFMTAFLTESRDYREIGRFCTSTPQRADGGKNSYSREACFHGIGHGSIIHHDPAEWKNPLEVVHETLHVCRMAAENETDFLKCAGGAYNGMAYDTYAKKILDPKDPFKICRQLSDHDSPADCYANLASVVFNLTPNKTLGEAIGLAQSFAPPQHLPRIISTFGVMAARQQNSAHEDVSTCLALTLDLKKTCLNGYVGGLVQMGTPEKKEEYAYALCSSDAIPQVEQTFCFRVAFNQLAMFWSREKIHSSCDLVSNSIACKAALKVFDSGARL